MSKRWLVVLVLAMCTAACGQNEKIDICEVNTIDDERPDILVIGDSISLGYTPPLKKALEDTYDVSHNYCNARHSMNGALKIDTWLDQRPHWEAITFNHGLHNAAGWSLVGDMVQTYKDNLTVIARKIKARTNKPLFILTTDILPGTPGHPVNHVPDLNQAALDVMVAEGIPVFDLYSVSQTIPHLHLNSTDVHYTPLGSRVLSNAILQELNTRYGIQ